MLNEANLFFIFLSAFLINNILLIRFLGLCSFIGISTNIKSSVGMGIAVVFVTVMACSISWAVYHFLLIPFKLEYLRTTTFILTIASFVQFEEMIIRKKLPTLYRAFGIYLPLITTNCAILASAFLGIDYKLSFIQNLIFSLGVSGGYCFVIIVFSAIREELEIAPIPENFKGVPIAFILAALMSLAFLGFKGLFKL
ncbi:MAG: RnfABCDGE type electron transport complex subunit A [Candidatus Omnitrophica bacterium]|nr:RnfABCDGE type electron transport complex subunit A [Candidatus Omnitrophota bacterium]MCM8808156.1 RnfABCDGE type electron transport complex subunit A [Candidatus Omnitrophota bacterium]